MELRKGIPVSPGICVAPVLLMDTDEIRIPQRFVEKEGRAFWSWDGDA